VPTLPCFRHLRPVASNHFSEIISDINSTLIPKNTQPPESSLHPGAGPRLIFPVLVRVLFSDADFHGFSPSFVGVLVVLKLSTFLGHLRVKQDVPIAKSDSFTSTCLFAHADRSENKMRANIRIITHNNFPWAGPRLIF
jgi:hypothetical protein